MKVRLPKNNMPGGGANNLQQLAMQAQKMQKQMDEIGAQLDEKEYTASAGGDAVKVTVKGTLEIVDMEVSKDIIDPDEPDMLVDLVIAATNDAIHQAQEDRNSQMESVSSGMNLPGLF